MTLLILFFIWSNFLTTGEKTEAGEKTAAIFSYAIFFNSFVLASQEMLQVCYNGLSYFTDFYNYLELTPIIFTPLTMVLYLKEDEFKEKYGQGHWTIKARALA